MPCIAFHLHSRVTATPSRRRHALSDCQDLVPTGRDQHDVLVLRRQAAIGGDHGPLVIAAPLDESPPAQHQDGLHRERLALQVQGLGLRA